jgi:hypothetical protein
MPRRTRCCDRGIIGTLFDIVSTASKARAIWCRWEERDPSIEPDRFGTLSQPLQNQGDLGRCARNPDGTQTEKSFHSTLACLDPFSIVKTHTPPVPPRRVRRATQTQHGQN